MGCLLVPARSGERPADRQVFLLPERRPRGGRSRRGEWLTAHATGTTISAWAVVLVGALWTLTTTVAEVTVIADLATSGDLPPFESWWSFAEGHGNGFSLLAVAVSVIAWNEIKDPQRLVPKWSAAVGAGAGLASFTGWSVGVWFDIGPANLVWVLASGVMCVWLAWLGLRSRERASRVDRGLNLIRAGAPSGSWLHRRRDRN